MSNLDPTQYKHYKLSRPVPTHYRKATCAEIECRDYLNGWITRIDESTDMGKQQGAYIRTYRKGQFVESRDDNGLTAFRFNPNFECFRASEHKIALEREPFYIVQTAGSRRVHANPMDWVEDFAEHQNRLIAATR